MRAEFISDNLAIASKPIRLFRDMLRYMDIDTEGDLRTERIREIFPAAFAFYDNLYHNYDINELLFITKRAYNLAGVKNSLILLGSYFGINFKFMAPDSEGEFTDETAFGNTYWRIHLVIDVPGAMVFKSLSIALKTINALVDELVYYDNQSDGQSPVKTIVFDRLVIEDDLKNTSHKYLNLTQDCLLDKYFDKNNIYLHSIDLDPELGYSVRFRTDGIYVEYAGSDDIIFQARYDFLNLYTGENSDDEGPVVSGWTGSRFSGILLEYPAIRCGVKYRFSCRRISVSDVKSAGGNVIKPEESDWKVLGKNGQLKSTDGWLVYNDVDILKGWQNSGFRFQINNFENTGEYGIYYYAGSSWKSAADRNLVFNVPVDVPYNSQGLTERSWFQLRIKGTDTIYMETRPPYLNA